MENGEERVRIRPETAADHGGIRKANKKAFGGKNESKLVDAVRESEFFVPELSLVAELGGQVVGHILFTPVLIVEGEKETPALALAPMCVLPEFQERGIGSMLVRRGLEECARLGHKLVVVLGHAEYYPRFGFVPAGERGLKLPFEAPAEAFMVRELVPGALDGVSGTVDYPDPFHEIV
jgi:putative acetyltransferase